MNDFDPTRQVAIVWSIEDVQQVRPDLNDDQCMEVLGAVVDKHDACIGVSWDTLEVWADYCYPVNK
jgi:hypothetical protein